MLLVLVVLLVLLGLGLRIAYRTLTDFSHTAYIPNAYQTLTEHLQHSYRNIDECFPNPHGILTEHSPSPHQSYHRTLPKRSPNHLPNDRQIFTEFLPHYIRAQQRRRSALEAAVGEVEAAESNRGMPSDYRVDDSNVGVGDDGEGGGEAGEGGGPGRWSRWLRLLGGVAGPDARVGHQDSAGED